MTRRCRGGEVGRAAARVDVPPVGLDADCGHLGAEAPERIGRDARHRSVRAVEPDRQARQVRAEADDRGEVVLLRALEPLDRASAGSGSVEEGLDRLVVLVRELLASRPEDLHPVVLRRVVRGGDDDAEILGKQGDGGRREHARDQSRTACGRDASRDRLLELRPGRACVATNENATPAGPERGGLTDLLDQLGCEVFARDPADAVGSEVTPRHGGRG